VKEVGYVAIMPELEKVVEVAVARPTLERVGYSLGLWPGEFAGAAMLGEAGALSGGTAVSA
jgi:hypothetical protein